MEEELKIKADLIKKQERLIQGWRKELKEQLDKHNNELERVQSVVCASCSRPLSYLLLGLLLHAFFFCFFLEKQNELLVQLVNRALKRFIESLMAIKSKCCMVLWVIEFTIQQDGSAQQIYALLQLQKSHFSILSLWNIQRAIKETWQAHSTAEMEL